MKNLDTKQFVFPKIKEKFENGNYPENYRPLPAYWASTIEELKETLPDGTFKLLTLDISISDDSYVTEVNKGLKNGDSRELTKRAEEFYECDVGCKHCFECKTQTDNLLMTTDEVFEMLLSAKELGLKSVKFLGPGELLHNPKLFEILDFLKENEINIGIFTKGLALGDDEYAQKYFKMNSLELCEKIASYPNVTILLGLISADKKTEEKRRESTKAQNLFEARNKAFENLDKVGLNNDTNCQKVALICAPVLEDNIDEALEIFKWAFKRNFSPILAPTMISGRGKEMPEIKNQDFKKNQLVNLYVNIYRWLIEEKIVTLSQIAEEGISPYPGFFCTQVLSGMLIRKDGQVQLCPGNDDPDFIYSKDVRKESLKDIWTKSIGYQLRKELIKSGKLTSTQPCYAKSEEILQKDGRYLVKKGEGSIPAEFYEKVMNKLEKEVEDKAIYGAVEDLLDLNRYVTYSTGQIMNLGRNYMVIMNKVVEELQKNENFSGVSYEDLLTKVNDRYLKFLYLLQGEGEYIKEIDEVINKYFKEYVEGRSSIDLKDLFISVEDSAITELRENKDLATCYSLTELIMAVDSRWKVFLDSVIDQKILDKKTD